MITNLDIACMRPNGLTVDPGRSMLRSDDYPIELLALALHAGIPVSSNDNDFEDAGVDWFTTAGLLRELSTKG
jgi:hypothetical protein